LGKGDGAKEKVVRRNKEQRIKRKNEQQWGEVIVRKRVGGQ